MDLPAFVDLLLDAQVLTFGNFTTKSGRATPYFLNFGNLATGAHIDAMGRAYAERVVATFGDHVDVLFGPAYKGIPLAIATAIALRRDHGLDVAWCFNRKEAKDHGEGGSLVGHVPTAGQRVVIIEDVTTAGTSIRETVPILTAGRDDVTIAGLVIALDRLERHSRDDVTALEEVADQFGLTATAITTIDEVVAHLVDTDHDVLTPGDINRIAAHRRQWGVR